MCEEHLFYFLSFNCSHTIIQQISKFGKNRKVMTRLNLEFLFSACLSIIPLYWPAFAGGTYVPGDTLVKCTTLMYLIAVQKRKKTDMIRIIS